MNRSRDSKKPPRGTVSFRVEIQSELAESTWLASDLTRVTNESEAALFTFHRSTTPGERERVLMRAHVVAGGIAAWMDIQLGIDGVRNDIRTALIADLWPDGEPERKSPAIARENEAAIVAAWRAEDSEQRRYLRTMQAMANRIDVIATWPILAVSVPPGWEDLNDRDDLTDEILHAILIAWNNAFEPVVEGKPQPSAS